jgi:hypothetical protein
MVSFDHRSAYLYVLVTGENTKENVASYLQDVQRECLAGGCLRVLIEERLVGPRLGATDVFDVAAGGSGRAVGAFQAIAYVDVNASGTMMKFAETVAVNRGVPVRLFAAVADAEAWLLGLPGSGRMTPGPKE